MPENVTRFSESMADICRMPSKKGSTQKVERRSKRQSVRIDEVSIVTLLLPNDSTRGSTIGLGKLSLKKSRGYGSLAETAVGFQQESRIVVRFNNVLVAVRSFNPDVF